MRVLLMTACGRSKEKMPLPAWRLYRSSRIRFLKKVAEATGVRYAILSARYGVVDSDEVIPPYEEIMTSERCEKLLPHIVTKLRDFSPGVIVFYRGGARQEYMDCIKKAADILGIRVIEVGYANMGDIRKVEAIINDLTGGS